MSTVAGAVKIGLNDDPEDDTHTIAVARAGLHIDNRGQDIAKGTELSGEEPLADEGQTEDECRDGEGEHHENQARQRT